MMTKEILRQFCKSLVSLGYETKFSSWPDIFNDNYPQEYLSVKLDSEFHINFTCKIYYSGLNDLDEKVTLYRIAEQHPMMVDETRSQWGTARTVIIKRSRLEISLLETEKEIVCNWLADNFLSIKVLPEWMRPGRPWEDKIGTMLEYAWTKDATEQMSQLEKRIKR
jgi:hypothetical protein